MRPFARHQKRKADDETTPNAADEFAQFFSNDPRPNDPPAEAPTPAVEPPPPTVTMEEQSTAGWYPDTKDPGLMRYWDGFHLTGQTMRVGPPPPVTPEPSAQPPVEAPAPPMTPGVAAPPHPPAPAGRFATAPQIPAAPPAPLLGSRLLPEAGADKVATPQPPDEAVSARPEMSAPAMDQPVPAPEAADADVPAEVATATPVAGPSDKIPVDGAGDDKADAPPAPVAAGKVDDQTNSWAERTEQAVAKAEAVGTPEAWREAAKAASVVSEMAQTMQKAAEMRQSAEQLGQAAEEAQRRADEAQEAVAEAQRLVQETAKAAREAEQAAAAAARRSEEAKRKAEQAAEATPTVTERAKDATQAAASAKRRAELVEEIVARAHQADTPEAWTEARRSAERAAGPESREGRIGA